MSNQSFFNDLGAFCLSKGFGDALYAMVKCKT